jgi:hypothetical protein
MNTASSRSKPLQYEKQDIKEIHQNDPFFEKPRIWSQNAFNLQNWISKKSIRTTLFSRSPESGVKTPSICKTGYQRNPSERLFFREAPNPEHIKKSQTGPNVVSIDESISDCGPKPLLSLIRFLAVFIIQHNLDIP